ncbi:MAG: hypothetical protein FWC32_11085 [Firmicutes bacterium]|nr:hypothetical protein [Bacillota bacterium]
MILKHYILRSFKDPMNLVMCILFPIIMIAIMTVAANAAADGLNIINGFNTSATNNTTFNALFFMFFSCMIVTDYLYVEFRSDLRWRLMATPVPFNKFIFSAIGASMIVTILNTTTVLLFGRFVLNAYLHNIFMTISVLLTMGILITLFGVLCFMLIPKKSTTTAVIMVFAFAQLLPIQFNMLSFERGVINASSFIPVVAAAQAVIYSGTMMIEFVGQGFADGIIRLEPDMRMALTHLGILVGYMVIAAIAVAILGRKRKI